MPKVSIIVPVYKVEKYLRVCFDSILAQTFTDFELILVDDGSPDNCPAICDEYADKDTRIRVIHKVNGGVSSARNAGLDAAKGEYITFADSDDYVFSDWLYSMVKADKADLIAAGLSRVSEDKREDWIPANIGYNDISCNRFKYICDCVSDYNVVGYAIYTKLFRSEIIRSNGIKFCETCENFAEDMGFVISYLMHCKTVNCLDYIGYNYRIYDDSMMGVTKNDIKLNAMNEVTKIIEPEYIKAFGSEKNFSVLYFLIMYNQYVRLIADKDRYQFAKTETQKIIDKKWFNKWTRRIFISYPELKQMYGKTNALKILAFSNYMLHGNWKRFTYESALLYKFLGMINHEK